MEAREITATLNLKKIIAESREVAQALNEFADDLERIEEKYADPQEKRCTDCNHYGKLSLDCGRCDDDCSMFEPQESEVSE